MREDGERIIWALVRKYRVLLVAAAVVWLGMTWVLVATDRGTERSPTASRWR
jgi:hypothetical protein